jgi:hypothetical protein
MTLSDEELGRVIRAALSGGATPVKRNTTAKKSPKAAPKKKRAPTAYQKHMKKELARLKKKHPKTSHQVLFKRAAKSWKRAKK